MAQELTLKTNKEPSWFNKEMAIGALIGIASPVGLGIVGLATLAGAAIGGVIGKNRMEKEKVEGKTVSDKPSFWNKDSAIGGLLGYMGGAIGAGFTLVSSLIGAGVAVEAGMTAGALIAAAATGALVAAGVVWAGSIALGTFIGGRRGQKVEREEFAQAAAQQSQVFRQPGYSMQYSTGHAAQLEQQLAQSQEKTR